MNSKARMAVVAGCLGMFAAGATPAADSTYAIKVLHSFGTVSNDGILPSLVKLTLGSDGNFYGVTHVGGANDMGTVFRMTPAGRMTILHSFAGTDDGAGPLGGLVQFGDGSYYGVTVGAGANGFGTIYKIDGAGNLSVVHAFTGADGSHAVGLSKGRDGNLYGSASSGGTNGGGVVFSLAPDESYRVVFNLGPTIGMSNLAAEPYAPVIQGSDGYLYGTGIYPSSGMIFRVSTQGTNYQTLHQLNVQAGDGSIPESGLVEGDDGNFYGTTYYTSTAVTGQPEGTLFRITPDGTFTTLYKASVKNIDKGYNFMSGLTKGADGNFYGVADFGGATNRGNVFMMTPAGVVTPLYQLGFQNNTPSGPESDLIFGTDGSLYGMSAVGGTRNEGTIFKLPLPAPAGWGTGTPPTVSLSVSPTTVRIGGTLTFSWTSTGATACALLGFNTRLPLPASGTLQVRERSPVPAPEVYSMSCTGNGLSGRGVVDVTVIK